MNRLSIISDSLDRAGHVRTQLAGLFETHCFHRGGIRNAEPKEYTIVDINLTDESHLSDIRIWLKLRPRDGKVIFAVEPGVRQQAVQAFAIGATDLVPRPIDGKMLVTKLLGDIESLAGDPSNLSIGNLHGISAGIGALQRIFASACLGAPLDPKTINTAGETVIAHIEAEGLVSWIDSVRKHHSQTYQHCLLVTALAVTFGRQLGFSSLDQQRLAFAGLLHDIGKARIPIAILEKPGPLDGDELAVMRQHPLLGFEAIRAVPGLHSEMLDMVVHHHEYLDGSGYPHGLEASELSDFVRIITIADIFGALIERRDYRAPLSGEAAYRILIDMGPKLDKDLVREFRAISRVEIG
jgi:putative nucleotidyltransferase with HDIG domain